MATESADLRGGAVLRERRTPGDRRAGLQRRRAATITLPCGAKRSRSRRGARVPARRCARRWTTTTSVRTRTIVSTSSCSGCAPRFRAHRGPGDLPSAVDRARARRDSSRRLCRSPSWCACAARAGDASGPHLSSRRAPPDRLRRLEPRRRRRRRADGLRPHRLGAAWHRHVRAPRRRRHRLSLHPAARARPRRRAGRARRRCARAASWVRC